MADDNRSRSSGPAEVSAGAGAAGTTICPVVGIGGSAGSLDVFKEFLRRTPLDTGLAFVAIQHLAPDHESVLAQLLGRCTEMPVFEAEDRMPIEPNHMYVIAPGTELTMLDGELRVQRSPSSIARRAPIDAFFLSLAEACGENAACILLSGSGHDGTLGLRAVKDKGGLTLVQSADSAAHDSMLTSAIRAGAVDLELPVETMPDKLVEYFEHLQQIGAPEKPNWFEPTPEQLQQICGRLRGATGHDFSEYKQSTLVRRIQRRMQVHQLTEVARYIDLLHRDRREGDLLFKDLLIGVTQFFRDAEAYEVLAREVMSKLVEGKSGDDEIRAWVAGCATGEEAYSIAMLLREALIDADDPPRLQLFASDIDEDALQFARTGRYPAVIERDVSSERLERFFLKEDGTYRVRSSVREMCVFAHHSVLRDPPFSRMHLISCRNLLIYLSNKVQERLLPVLHYALRPGGYLFLGPSETVGRGSKLFGPVDKKQRIFVRREDGLKHLPKFPIGNLEKMIPRCLQPVQPAHPRPALRAPLSRRAEAILGQYSPAYVIIDDEYGIVSSSRRTGRYLELGGGRPELNVLTMARPDLRAELRAAVQEAGRSGGKALRRNLQIVVNGGMQIIDLVVEPLPGDDHERDHYVILFQEIGPAQPEPEPSIGQASGEGAERVIAQLEVELRDARERLHTVTEQLETSNEELRSSNEELSSVNEEMQSTNEELQTSKEELQSINEELQTVNLELNNRIDDLSSANNYLKNLLENMQLPMVFLDTNLSIRNFTPSAIELFSLRESDVGRPITDITSRLDYQHLEEDIREVARTQQGLEHEVEAANGRAYIMRVLLYRTTEDVIDGIIITFTEITERRRSEEHQKMLVSELSHRVKNTLATVQAIALRTISGAPSLDAFREAFIGRIRALGAAHSLLTDSDWQGARLHAVISGPLEAYRDKGERIGISGEDFPLSPRAALILSLIINELSTNAAKYGPLSSPTGRVEIETSMRESDLGPALAILWRESGGPAVEPPGQGGFGIDLIERSASYELDGTAKVEFRPEGVRCEIVIPYYAQSCSVG
jgi:two-component system, chemotaxis family, CheB/CheR fusion protein